MGYQENKSAEKIYHSIFQQIKLNFQSPRNPQKNNVRQSYSLSDIFVNIFHTFLDIDIV